jgi:hypothetical protein
MISIKSHVLNQTLEIGDIWNELDFLTTTLFFFSNSVCFYDAICYERWKITLFSNRTFIFHA